MPTISSSNELCHVWEDQKMQGFVKQSQFSPVPHKWKDTSIWKMNVHRHACEVSVPCRDPNAVKRTAYCWVVLEYHMAYARALTPIPNPSRWVVNWYVLLNEWGELDFFFWTFSYELLIFGLKMATEQRTLYLGIWIALFALAIMLSQSWFKL